MNAALIQQGAQHTGLELIFLGEKAESHSQPFKQTTEVRLLPHVDCCLNSIHFRQSCASFSPSALFVQRWTAVIVLSAALCQEILSHNENENNVSEPTFNLFFTHPLSTVCFFSTMSLLSSVLIVVPAESLAHWSDSYYNHPQEWFSTKTLYNRSNRL